jgi:hypothetical protein
MLQNNCCYFWCFKMGAKPENDFLNRHNCGTCVRQSLSFTTGIMLGILFLLTLAFIGFLLGLFFSAVNHSDECSNLLNISFTITQCFVPGFLSSAMILLHLMASVPITIIFFGVINRYINTYISHNIISHKIPLFFLMIPKYPRIDILIFSIEMIISIVNALILFPLTEKAFYSPSCSLIDYYWIKSDHNKLFKSECILRDLTCVPILYGIIGLIFIIWFIYNHLTTCIEDINDARDKESTDQSNVIIV